MKIYQIHKFGGGYEDYSDRIIGSYLNEHRAYRELIKLQAERIMSIKASQKCKDCPLYRYGVDSLSTAEIHEYCDKAEIVLGDPEYDDYECRNYHVNYWVEEYDYEIKEVDVIE